jgi:hypothetical protein
VLGIGPVDHVHGAIGSVLQVNAHGNVGVGGEHQIVAAVERLVAGPAALVALMVDLVAVETERRKRWSR